MGTQGRVPIREPAGGVEQGIEFAGGGQLVESAQAVEHVLADLAVDALILAHEQVNAVAIGLGANEPGAVSAVSSLESRQQARNTSYSYELRELSLVMT